MIIIDSLTLLLLGNWVFANAPEQNWSTHHYGWNKGYWQKTSNQQLFNLFRTAGEGKKWESDARSMILWLLQIFPEYWAIFSRLLFSHSSLKCICSLHIWPSFCLTVHVILNWHNLRFQQNKRESTWASQWKSLKFLKYSMSIMTNWIKSI